MAAYLDENLRINHGHRHGRIKTGIIDHVLHRDRAAHHLLLHLKNLLLLGLELDILR